MIPALDSSFSVPTLAQAQAAYAGGVRAWGGYLVSDSDDVVLANRAAGQGMYGLACPWTLEEFRRVQQAGLTAVGFCSGWDNPSATRAKAEANGILACVDAEAHIRDDGPWVAGWVMEAQCGLYGAMSVHYESGEVDGRGALFNILAWYPGYDPRATWFDDIQARPLAPCGWQWWGTHDEFGCSVDRSWFDDLIIPSGPGRGGPDTSHTGGGSSSMVTITGADGRTHRLTVTDSGVPDEHGNRGGPVHWAAIEGGPGGILAWGGGDAELPGGGGWIAGGTLAAELWPWPDAPGGPRELIVVHGRGQGSGLWMKAVFTDDFSVQTEWVQVGGRPVPCIPGTAPTEDQTSPVSDAHIAEVAAAEIDRRIANG